MSATLLAFDTSTDTLSVALQWPGGRSSWDGPGGALASAALLPRVRLMMAEAGVRWADLSAVAFGRGPGAFTGLRTACAAAQGLAYGTGLPVLPIDSLHIVAEDVRRQAAADRQGRLDVAVAMDARMGQVYAARYRWEGDAWQTLAEPALCDPPDVAALWTPAGEPCALPDVLAGTGVAIAVGGDEDAAGWARVPTVTSWAGRAAALLSLADDAWRACGAVPPAQALPLYLRDKVALTTAERAALRDGAR